jgi:hypothetical protein
VTSSTGLIQLRCRKTLPSHQISCCDPKRDRHNLSRLGRPMLSSGPRIENL